ncbi:MAG: hypothetical protein EOO05_18685 [Chitinophagaceae bacterium]|nr:MAG: hypothetical protein EOO05_18685 [Chitinophagaceae bacterium]
MQPKRSTERFNFTRRPHASGLAIHITCLFGDVLAMTTKLLPGETVIVSGSGMLRPEAFNQAL